jgi:hypothetical protein
MAHINRNYCKTFNVALNKDTVTKLADQECTEVMFSSTSDDIKIYDKNNPTAYFVVPKNTVATIKGVTNSMDLSAMTATGSHTIGYRTQFYSGLQQTFV